VGGTCRHYVEVATLTHYQQVMAQARRLRLAPLVIGEGSNLLFSDHGFDGLVIRNRIGGLKRDGKRVEIGGGESLGKVIRWLNRNGLSGLERMYGIPGTVAGAIVGNAGAYGQEIGDVVTDVDIWADGRKLTVAGEDLDLRYRHSRFKTAPNWFLVSCRLQLEKSGNDLQSISDEILAKRRVKYPQALRCPGSFFKNIVLKNLPNSVRQKIPDSFEIAGKVPAGKLLEAVGAKGARRGDAQFADYHGNLLVNLGRATSDDILGLANEYAGRVLDRFGIHLEPEILIIDDREWSHLRCGRATS
jgi:UDP-N-acetylmuramate dehydrogenase